MIEDLGECQNTGIHVTRIKINGRTQYLTSRHRDAARKKLAGLAARYRPAQETVLPSRQKVLEEMIHEDLTK
jgi:hypothetical protein